MRADSCAEHWSHTTLFGMWIAGYLPLSDFLLVFVVSCESRFSCGALEPHTTLFGMWIAGYFPLSDFWLVLKALLGILAGFLGSFYVDHVRFHLSHPYIERIWTL